MDKQDERALAALWRETEGNVRGMREVVHRVGDAWQGSPCRERLTGLLSIVPLWCSDRFAWRVEPPGGQRNAPVVVSSFDESMVRREYPRVGRVPRVFRVVEESREALRERARGYGCRGVLEDGSSWRIAELRWGVA